MPRISVETASALVAVDPLGVVLAEADARVHVADAGGATAVLVAVAAVAATALGGCVAVAARQAALTALAHRPILALRGQRDGPLVSGITAVTYIFSIYGTHGIEVHDVYPKIGY